MPTLAKKVAIRVPTETTLRKYGLTADEWRELLAAQGDVCYICLKLPVSGVFVTDHEHVRGFKKLEVAERRQFVRGIVCRFCNSHVVGRFVTLAKARRAVQYLQEYEDRKKTNQRAIK